MVETVARTVAAKKPAAKKAAGKTMAGKTAAPSASRLKVTLVKSTIGFDRKQGLVVESLGLRRLRHAIDVADTPAVRGMLLKVRHLVTVTSDE